MGKIEGSWSGMRKYLEKEMLAPSLKGKIRYNATTYIGMDGDCIFDLYVDGEVFKRFSFETVNSYFIENKISKNQAPFGAGDYWEGFWDNMEKYPIKDRTEYTDQEFCQALDEYRNQPIDLSLKSDNPLVRMFAILDRRIGKRTLIKLIPSLNDQVEWLKDLYKLRLKSENIPY